MKKWAKNYEELILKSTEYSGSREPNAKVLSASSINKENYYLMNQYNFESGQMEAIDDTLTYEFDEDFTMNTNTEEGIG